MTQALCHASLDVLDHLRAAGSCTAEQIHDAMSAGRPHLRPRDTMRRLNRLEALHWLYSDVGNDGAVRWHALAVAPDTLRPAPRPKAFVGQVAPPRRIDIMNSTWVPPAGPALRPGALDYQRCASHGVQC